MAVRVRRIPASRWDCWPSVQTVGTWHMALRETKAGLWCWTIKRVNPTKTCSAWEAARSCLTPQTVFTTPPHAVRTSTWCRSSSSKRTDRKIKRDFCPGVHGSAPPEPPPPGRSIASLYRCLRLQVGSLALAGSKSHGGCGAYYSACLLACLLLVEYMHLLMHIAPCGRTLGMSALSSGGGL